MSKEIFNPATYLVIDRITGEEVDIQLFVEMAGRDKWRKVYMKTLANFIGVGGSSSGKVLAFLINDVDIKNRILGTQREIAKSAGVSARTVGVVFAALKKQNMLKEVRNGCYFLSPSVSVYGNKVHAAMLLRLWGEIK